MNNTTLVFLIDKIYKDYVKPFYINSETGEQGYCEWNDAKELVLDILTSDYNASLLHSFWQRTSDACPLEATAAEKEEDDFFNYVKSLNKTK